MESAIKAAESNDFPTLGSRLGVFNLFAKPFPWCKKPTESEPRTSQPRRIPRHHRQVVLDGSELSRSGQHRIGQEEEGLGVELYPASDDSEPYRVSLSLQGKNTMSTTTDSMSTLSSKPGGEDCHIGGLSGTSIFLK